MCAFRSLGFDFLSKIKNKEPELLASAAYHGFSSTSRGASPFASAKMHKNATTIGRLPSAMKSVQVQKYFATSLLRTQRDKSTKCLDCEKRCDFACCWKLLEDG